MPVTFGNQGTQEPLRMPDGMRYIGVCGPDKIALYGFVKYLQDIFGTTWKHCSLHALMSPEASEAYLGEFLSRCQKGTVAYFARRKINVPDPTILLPPKYLEIVDITLWFDLYNTDPKVLKDKHPEFTAWLLAGWKKRLGE